MGVARGWMEGAVTVHADGSQAARFVSALGGVVFREPLLLDELEDPVCVLVA